MLSSSPSLLTFTVAVIVWIGQASKRDNEQRRHGLLLLETVLQKLGLLNLFTFLLICILIACAFWKNAPQADKAKQAVQRREVIGRIRDFLRSTGGNRDIFKGILHPNLFTNFVILQRIHQQIYAESILNNNNNVPSSTTTNNKQHSPQIWDEVSRMLRYSLAIYGSQMVAATEIELAIAQKDRPILPTLWNTFCKGLAGSHSSSHPSTKQLLCQLNHVNPTDIVLLESSNSMDCPTHALVVDHRHQQIVWTIRGSLCVNDLFGVLQVTGTPFLGGHAHFGFATLAQALWKSGSEALSDLPPHYELVLTGHSLGASVAMLLTHIILEEQQQHHVDNRPVRCVAFGPMPSTTLPVPNCTAFCYGDDLVPQESLHTFRVLNEHLAAVNRERSSMGYWDVVRLILGWKEPSKELQTAIRAAAEKLPPVPGAPLLTIPASNRIHLSTNGQAVCCQGNLPPMIRASTKWMAHHTPAQYQAAIHTVVLGGR